MCITFEHAHTCVDLSRNLHTTVLIVIETVMITTSQMIYGGGGGRGVNWKSTKCGEKGWVRLYSSDYKATNYNAFNELRRSVKPSKRRTVLRAKGSNIHYLLLASSNNHRHHRHHAGPGRLRNSFRPRNSQPASRPKRFVIVILEKKDDGVACRNRPRVIIIKHSERSSLILGRFREINTDLKGQKDYGHCRMVFREPNTAKELYAFHVPRLYARIWLPRRCWVFRPSCCTVPSYY